MELHTDKTSHEQGAGRAAAWLVAALGFLVVVWVAVGWAVHSLVTAAAGPV